jgi:hypothetical protein
MINLAFPFITENKRGATGTATKTRADRRKLNKNRIDEKRNRRMNAIYQNTAM